MTAGNTTLDPAPAGLSDDARADLYGLLARLFGRELTADEWSQLRRGGVLELMAEDLPESFDEEGLAAEYARLFVGPGPAAPPFGSVYRPDDARTGELLGTTTGEIRRFMSHHGLEPRNPGQVADRVNVLFEFLERIVRAGTEARSRGDDTGATEALRIEERFFREHVDSWIDAFLERVQNADPGPFYGALANLARGFVASERKRLG